MCYDFEWFACFDRFNWWVKRSRASYTIARARERKEKEFAASFLFGHPLLHSALQEQNKENVGGIAQTHLREWNAYVLAYHINIDTIRLYLEDREKFNEHLQLSPIRLSTFPLKNGFYLLLVLNQWRQIIITTIANKRQQPRTFARHNAIKIRGSMSNKWHATMRNPDQIHSILLSPQFEHILESDSYSGGYTIQSIGFHHHDHHDYRFLSRICVQRLSINNFIWAKIHWIRHTK